MRRRHTIQLDGRSRLECMRCKEHVHDITWEGDLYDHLGITTTLTARCACGAINTALDYHNGTEGPIVTEAFWGTQDGTPTHGLKRP